MDVLQHDPVTFFISLLDSSACDFVLALTQWDAEEGLSCLDSVSISIFLDNLLDLFDWIGTWRQDEEDRNLGLWVSNDWAQNVEEGRFRVHFDVLLSFGKDVPDKTSQGHCDTIRSKTSQDQ